LFALATSQPHKEERFVLLAYPLLLIAAGGVAGRWLGSRAADERGGTVAAWRKGAWTVRRVLGAVGVALLVADGAHRLTTFDYDIPRARFMAQAWVGTQPDVRGLLVDWPYYTGGYLWFGRTLPELQYKHELLPNTLFSHVLMRKDDGEVRSIAAAGFHVVYDRDGVVVLQRTEPGARGTNASTRD
jgi:hypothetical protein